MREITGNENAIVDIGGIRGEKGDRITLISPTSQKSGAGIEPATCGI